MTAPLTDRIAAALEGVTEGPWGCNRYRMFGPISDHDDQSFGMVLEIGQCDYDGGTGDANARFIAAARTLLPEALEEITRLEFVIDQLQQELADASRNAESAYQRGYHSGGNGA